jgi:hypothetical protein
MMMRRRPKLPTGVISAVAVIAVWLSVALSGARTPASNDAANLHAIAAEAPSTPLPAVRQVAVELSTPFRASQRSPGVGLVGIDRPGNISIAARPQTRALSTVFGQHQVRPRRLAFRYDATAPPAVL